MIDLLLALYISVGIFVYFKLAIHFWPVFRHLNVSIQLKVILAMIVFASLWPIAIYGKSRIRRLMWN